MMRPQNNRFRQAIDIGGLWRIRFDPNDVGEKEGWTTGIGEGLRIAVPGSWNEQLAEAGYMNYVGAAWYETTVFVPASFSGRRVALRFGSADYRADVWVNGVFVGSSGPAHLPFEVDVTSIAEAGASCHLVVRVDNRLPEQGPTQRVTQTDYRDEGRLKDEYLPTVRFDFFPYGGLARPVYLTACPRDGITEIKAQIGARESQGLLGLTVRTQGAVSRVEVRVKARGQIHSVQSVVKGEHQTNLALIIDDCPLWSPESPTLFDATIHAFDQSGQQIDEALVRTGFRDVRVQGRQLLLNGAPIALKGFGKHEDSPMRGRGLDLPQLIRDFQLLKWCGANSVRTSHYPYSEEFYDLCDEQGILVIDEVFSINLDFRKVRPEGLQAHKAAVAALMARDAHRPCVIAWSLANEPGYLGEKIYSEASREYWNELFAFARSLDATRPLTHANVSYAGLDDPAFDVSDFLMINRYYGWYQAPGDLDRAIEMLTRDFDQLAGHHAKPIFVSEFGADALAGQHSTTPQLFSEDFQADMVEAYWRAIVAHPAVMGGHVWNFADFRTAQHSRRVVFNLKGVFTRDRTPKKAAYRLRDLWTPII